MSGQGGEREVGRTLYAVILAGLIEWAGDDADLGDCREVARYITPIVREYVRTTTPPEPHGGTQ